jgi:diaminopimelate decarboxylase
MLHHEAGDRGYRGIPLDALAGELGTPYYVYDAAWVRERIAAVKAITRPPAIVARYAMKACSANKVLSTVREAGLWIDAVSANEVRRALTAGFPSGNAPPAVLLSADVFRDGALELAQQASVLPNLGSPGMIDELGRAGYRGPVGLRINPGFGHGHVRACDTGGPSSKHGIWADDEPAVRREAAARGQEIVLLHAHVGTGSGAAEFLANMDRLREFYLKRVEHYPRLEAVNFGGGIPHPYRPETPPIDLRSLGDLLARAREEISARAGRPLRLETEPGRYLVAGGAALVTRVSDVKRTTTNEKGSGQTFVMVDAGFTDLVRPAMYGSYHRITAFARSIEEDGAMEAVVAGPLCESGDVFTRDAQEFIEPRRIPRVKPGDLLVIHDAGAYGAVMSSNYNSLGRAPQVWWESGKAHLMSRRETIEDITRTECWEEVRGI